MNLRDKKILISGAPDWIKPAIETSCNKAGLKTSFLDIYSIEYHEFLNEKPSRRPENLKKLDILLIFAPLSKKHGPIKDTSMKIFDEHFKDFWKILSLTKSIYQSMMRARSGRIVLVLGSSGLESYPCHAIPCTITSALAGLFETIAIESGEFNINISILHEPLLNPKSMTIGCQNKIKNSEQAGTKIAKNILKALKQKKKILINHHQIIKIKRKKNSIRIKDFKDKVILITGAASGIGKAFTTLLSKKGAHMALLDVNAEKLSRLSSLLKNKGMKCLDLAVDLRNREEMDLAVQQIIEEFDHVDGLVNNAGIAIMGLFPALLSEDFENTLKVNLLAPIYLSKLILPQLSSQKSGFIVNIASIDAVCPLPFLSPYNAAKRGLRFYSNALRLELEKHGICISTIYPGAVNTNISKSAIIRTDFISLELTKNKENSLKGSVVKMFDPLTLASKALKGLEKGDPNQFILPVLNKLVLHPWINSPEMVLPLMRNAVKGIIRKNPEE
ncbi:MAG: SDR family NAD(P)-dependent oxidoreductase [Candidatus Helarchaeales archaeon]